MRLVFLVYLGSFPILSQGLGKRPASYLKNGPRTLGFTEFFTITFICKIANCVFGFGLFIHRSLIIEAEGIGIMIL
jgi:hypothetical protein